MNYHEQLIYVRSLPLGNGHYRGDCPVCGGKNTFSVSSDTGNILWFCYRASCGARGKHHTGRSATDIRRSLRQQQEDRLEFDLPNHFTNALSNEQAVTYLRNNNCIDAIAKRRADIRYDPRLNRVVFVCKLNSNIVGATGRALTAGTKPKWYRYDSNQVPFICGSGSTAVLVEDAASACAVSELATGVALMGTNLSDSLLTFLRDYARVLVCLDPDALRKALDISRTLAYLTSTTVVRIPDDLKYYSSEQIAEILRL